MHFRTCEKQQTCFAKNGYQPIALFGDRYLMKLENGQIKELVHYNKKNNDSNTTKQNISNWIQNNETLSNFTGILEIVYNSHFFKIIDLLLEGPQINQVTYKERIEMLINLFTEDSFVSVIKYNNNSSTNNITTPTILRSLDSAYTYGSDFLISLANNEHVYMVIGEAEEPKRHITLYEKDFNTMEDVPEVIRKKFENTYNLNDFNKWKNEQFVNPDNVHIRKFDNAKYITIENPETTNIFLVAGFSDNKLKIFGKINKQVKVLNNVNFEEFAQTDVYEWADSKMCESLQNVKVYTSGYVVGVAEPKINRGKLCSITPLNLYSQSELYKTENVNDVPYIGDVMIKKKLKQFSNENIVGEFAQRLMERENNDADNIHKILKAVYNIFNIKFPRNGFTWMNYDEDSTSNKRMFCEDVSNVKKQKMDVSDEEDME